MKKLDKTFIVVLIIVMLLYGLSILLTEQGLPCYFHELTGLFCPGCGITRMVISLVNLEFYQAFRYNALIFIFLICSIVFITVDIVVFCKRKKHINIPSQVYIFILIITIIFGIIRNISFFSYLAPTVVK